MYDELVKMLRTCALIHGQCAVCYYHGNPCNALTEIPLAQAADAIEELKKALDAVNDAHNEGYDVGYWAGRRDYEPKWIPVTERLPEIDMSYPHHEDYLVQYDSGNMDVASWSNVNRFWTDHVTEPHWNCVQFAEVIAWMPLPEPPKEVTQDD